MKDLRVVFMGTPKFSLEPLKALVENCYVVCVVTKMDAPLGRKKVLTPSPVAVYARSHNIPVLKPKSIKKEYQSIINYEPDIIITCAYGKIIPKSLIQYPKYGAINIHASILPKYRGAAPIQWALINGEKKTGVTLMYMDEFMDTGDIITQSYYEIKESDNAGTLFQNLSVIGSKLLMDNLDNIINGKVKRIKQNEEDATYAPMITREMEELDYNTKVINVFNKIRAFSPEPLTKTNIKGEEVKIVSSHYTECKSIVGKLYVTKDSLGIGCLDGIIYFDTIKPSGKTIMPIKNYLNGKKNLLKESRDE